MSITRIVSGGQTGADRGGLEAAIHCDLPHGGWCPKGRKAEDGPIPAQYLLREMPTADYLARTEANVADSDCTVIFAYGALEGGSRKTADYAKRHNKPWLHVNLMSKPNRQQTVQAIVEWLQECCPKDCVLNVAGQRASKAPSIAGVVKAWMVDVISKINGTLFYPIGEEFYEEGPKQELPPPYVPPSDEPAEALSGYHPKTVEEAVQILLRVLTPEQKEQIALKTKDEFCGEQHFGMAMWIRNAMIHGNENQIDLMADFEKGCREGQWEGYPEPDSVSGVLVKLVWDRLQAGHGGSP